MKRKELKELATKIAKCELILQTSTDEKAIQDAKMEIMRISSTIDWSDSSSLLIDDMVQELLEKNHLTM